MIATHSLSKPLNVFTLQAHKPTILNLHPNNVTILSSSISGGNWRMLRQEMRLRDHLQPTETMGLSGPDPEVVATKRPISRMCMCQNKRVPSWRSLTLEFLRGGTAPSEVLLVAKRARLTPHLLDNAEREFKEILWHDRVEFEDLKKCAWRMEMSRKEDAAVRELLWYISACKGSQEIYEAQILLVEMLIYQGDYGKARQTLEGVQLGPTDYRLQFYPAVICVLLGKEDEAKKHWDAFNKMSEVRFRPSPPKVKVDGDEPGNHLDAFNKTSEVGLGASPPKVDDDDEAGNHWDAFKQHVKVLGQEITAVRNN